MSLEVQWRNYYSSLIIMNSLTAATGEAPGLWANGGDGGCKDLVSSTSIDKVPDDKRRGN